jgi:hypothetical protein
MQQRQEGGMERNRALRTAAGVTATVVAGAMALAASFGVLAHTDHSNVGTLSAKQAGLSVSVPAARRISVEPSERGERRTEPVRASEGTGDDD